MFLTAVLKKHISDSEIGKDILYPIAYKSNRTAKIKAVIILLTFSDANSSRPVLIVYYQKIREW